MKRLGKLILAIFLSFILLLSTIAVSFAGDDGDPYGCYYAKAKYEVKK